MRVIPCAADFCHMMLCISAAYAVALVCPSVCHVRVFCRND